MSSYIRTVTTSPGATAVQIIYSRAGGRRTLDHIGSAHSGVALAIRKAQAQRTIDAEQHLLD